MNIYQKMVAIRQAVPYLQKAENGPQYQYVSSSQTVSAVRDLLNKHGIFLKTEMLGQELKEFHTAKGALQFMTTVHMRFTWINAENQEEQIVSLWEGQGVDNGEKGIGKAATYAEKYFILKTFNIPTDKDDPDAYQAKVEESKPEPKATQTQIDVLKGIAEAIAEKVGKEPSVVYEAFNINQVKTVSQFEIVKKKLNAQINAIAAKEKEAKQDATA